MTEKLAQTIKEDLVKLPLEAQKAITSSGWEEITEMIGRKYSLLDDDVNIIQLEVGLVLLGYNKISMFAQNIRSSAVLDEETAMNISKELDERVFTPIEQSMQSLIKINPHYKNVNWDQTINFIVSGGDYSVFLDK
ncbi:MAG: hypothetical protein WCW04_02700 [Candidatus Paceibacterota bacterium]|jgi:hypothetical protein